MNLRPPLLVGFRDPVTNRQPRRSTGFRHNCRTLALELLYRIEEGFTS